MRHQFWAVGDAQCPPELRAPNGELHTTRCKACGDGWRRTGNLCLSKAASDVLAERQGQIEREGWTPEHDDEHASGELADAAACYALSGDPKVPPPEWPWATEWWKPKDRRHDLVRAAALLLAEIERLDRAEQKGGA